MKNNLSTFENLKTALLCNIAIHKPNLRKNWFQARTRANFEIIQSQNLSPFGY